MAGFGSISLTQTAVGSLLDQRAVVLYDDPLTDEWRASGFLSTGDDYIDLSYEKRSLWGQMKGYQELFSGLLGDMGAVSTIANTSGLNPYGITYVDAKVNIESDLIEHPVETGQTMMDTAIRQPITADVTVVMPTVFAERIYNQIMKYYYDKDKRIILQTKYGVYNHLVLKDISYELKYDKIDRTEFILSLKEIITAYEGFTKLNEETVRDVPDSSTINTGSQAASEG